MLFDLSNDMGEVTNIAARHPEQHKKLHAEMMSYFEQVGARIPKLNPDAHLKVYEQDKDYRKRKDGGAFKGRRPLEEDERQPHLRIFPPGPGLHWSIVAFVLSRSQENGER